MMTPLVSFKTRHGSSEQDPLHEHKGCNRVGCTVNPVTITLFICRSNRSEVRQLCFSPFMTGICSFRSTFLFTLSFILIPWRRWEKQEKHMDLHPDNAVCFTRAPGYRVTVLGVSSSFQAPLPATVALGFPEYKPFLSFSMTCSPSWKNLGQPLALQASCFLSINGNDSFYFSHSQDSCEDPLKNWSGRAVQW